MKNKISISVYNQEDLRDAFTNVAELSQKGYYVREIVDNNWQFADDAVAFGFSKVKFSAKELKVAWKDYKKEAGYSEEEE